MQNNRFVVLTGHLNNYPLSDLVGILRHQRKSGRLLIEYPKGPATLFFEEGELVDVRLNELSGLQAICVLLAQPEASFNFNPLIKSLHRTIEPEFQRVVSELFGCWDESAIQIESARVARQPALESAEDLSSSRPAIEGRSNELLALPPAPPVVRQRSLFMMAAAVLIIVAISTVIAVTGRLGQTSPPVSTQANNSAPTVTSAPESKTVQSSAKPTGVRSRSFNSDRRESRIAGNKSQENGEAESSNSTTRQPAKANDSAGSIKVIMQIENGRVLKASVANHEPGMDGFEALALRIARQRRYPANKSGAEAVTITVNKPE